jgi:hypothetical protein
MTSTWRIEISPEGVYLQRLHNDHVIEAYAKVDHGKAAIYLTAILNGFQPPRALVRLDTPSD